jgi:hypothetical protein
VIGKVKPSTVEVATPKVGVFAAPVSDLIDEDVAVPVSNPVLVVTTVTVDAVPGLTPVTVMRPVPTLIEADLPSELVTDQVVAVS